MEPKQELGDATREAVNSGNVVAFDAGRRRRRMVMVPESEWLEVLAAVRDFRKVAHGCPMARRLLMGDD